MAFDFKKEYKEFYLPAESPSLVDVKPANYVAVRGQGNPNDEEGEYKKSIELLYGIAYTIKMSKKGDHRIEGYFDFVVPPLEGLWWTGSGEMNYARKDNLRFISMLRLPDFVTEEDFRWAVETATKKKGIDFSNAEFFHYEEGLCVQCMHVGSYDMEPITLGKIRETAGKEGYEPDLKSGRLHHEIYLSDPRKTSNDKLRTVIRIPVKPTAR